MKEIIGRKSKELSQSNFIESQVSITPESNMTLKTQQLSAAHDIILELNLGRLV